MTLNEWIQMNANIEVGGGDVPMFIQTGIYTTLLQGHGFQSETAVVQRAPPVAAIQGHAYVHYNGRAQVSHNGIPAEFPVQQPRLLAAKGGVSSAGRSSCADLDIHGAFKSRDGAGSDVGEEVAWLSLHRWLLFFEAAPEAGTEGADTSLASPASRPPPYAFMSLRRTVLRVVDAASCRLVLASRSDTKSHLRTNAKCDEWLDLCLLLADGRFQPLEAPRLQLRFDERGVFEAWAARLAEACQDPVLAPAAGPRLSATRPPLPGSATSGSALADKEQDEQHEQHTIL